MLKQIFIPCFFVSSFAWLAPERCAQEVELEKSVISGTPTIITNHSETINIRSDSNSSIKKIAEKQHETLIETYKNYEFIGISVKASTNEDNLFPDVFEIRTPYNCKFYTYDPRLLSSVVCVGSSCKLSHTVSTIDTYTASEGYNWGVKISSKLSFFAKLFEVGGEVSVGGTYSCLYTKGKTTTDLVECSDSSGKDGVLQLYNVKSDMKCDFGKIKLQKDVRGNGSTDFILYDPENYLTSDELDDIGASVQTDLQFVSDRRLNFNIWNEIPPIVPTYGPFIIDTDKISDGLLRKFSNKFPFYNPYTDLILFYAGLIGEPFLAVGYYKKNTTVQEYERIIPFTNENGDSVYEYACIKVPL